MPRTLPWLAGASKKDTKRSSPAPRQSKKRSSSPDRLVNSDLEDVDTPPRNAVTKKRRKREPSSSPPPTVTAPEITYMNEGLKADDIFVMVEDEFYSTAQLFTAPLHRAAYDRLRRLHRSRGQETLANLERATDKSTKPSTALRRKMEAEERAKKSRGRSAVEEESDDDDEYMAVPELAGLMTSTQSLSIRTGLENVTKAKSNTRAAAGFSQSPHKAKKTKDVFANSRMSPVREAESTDDDDLDRGVTTSRRAYEDMDSSFDEPRPSIEKPSETKSTSTGFFKQFAKEAGPDSARATVQQKQLNTSPAKDHALSRESSPTPATNGFPPRQGGGGKGSRMAELLAKRKQQSTQDTKPSMVLGGRLSVTAKPIKPMSSPDSSLKPPPTSKDTTSEGKSSEYLVQRRAAREKKEAEEKKKKTRRDDIPTFLF